MINQAKKRLIRQRTLAKQGISKIHGVYDSAGKPLIHEENFIDNNNLLKKKAYNSQYPDFLKGEVKEGYITVNPKLEKHRSRQIGFM